MKLIWHRKLHLYTIYLFIVICLLRAHPAAQAQAQSNQLPSDLALYVILDESDSMWDRNDPDSYRIDALDTLIDTLGAMKDVRASMSVIFFGSRVERVSQSTALNDPAARTKLKTLIHQKHYTDLGPMGFTDIAQAWGEVAKLVQPDATLKQAILVLTDGQPETEATNTVVDKSGTALGKYLEQVRASYGGFRQFSYQGMACPAQQAAQGIPLYVVGVSEGAKQDPKSKSYSNIWQELTQNSGGLYLRNQNKVQEFPSLTLGTMQGWLCAPVDAGQELALSPGQVLTYTLPASDLLKGMSVTIVAPNHDAHLAVDLLKPDHTPSTPDGINVIQNSSEHDQSWSLWKHAGWQGDWTLEIRSDTPTTATLHFIPVSDAFTVQFEQPAGSIYPRGKPLPIAIRALGSGGESLLGSLTKLELQVLNSQTNQSEPVTLNAQSDPLRATYTHTLLDDPNDPGDRTLVFNAEIKIGEHQLPIQRTKPVTFNPWPWLEVLTPTVGLVYQPDQVIPLVVQVMVEGNPDVVTAQTAKVQADVLDAAGNGVRSVPLAFDPKFGESALSAQLPAGVLKTEGEYTITYTLPQSDSVPLQDQVTSTLVIKIPPTPTFTPTPSPTATPTFTSTPRPTATPTFTPTPTWTPTQTPTLPPPPTPTLIPPEKPLGEQYPWLLPLLGGMIGLLILWGIVRMLQSRPTLNGMTLNYIDGQEVYMRGRRYPFVLGEGGDGVSAATLSIRPRRSPGRGIVAEVRVEKLAAGVNAIQVGESEATSAEYGQGNTFDWHTDMHIFAGDEQVRLYNPNEIV